MSKYPSVCLPLLLSTLVLPNAHLATAMDFAVFEIDELPLGDAYESGTFEILDESYLSLLSGYTRGNQNIQTFFNAATGQIVASDPRVTSNNHVVDYHPGSGRVIISLSGNNYGLASIDSIDEVTPLELAMNIREASFVGKDGERIVVTGWLGSSRATVAKGVNATTGELLWTRGLESFFTAQLSNSEERIMVEVSRDNQIGIRSYDTFSTIDGSTISSTDVSHLQFSDGNPFRIKETRYSPSGSHTFVKHTFPNINNLYHIDNLTSQVEEHLYANPFLFSPNEQYYIAQTPELDLELRRMATGTRTHLFDSTLVSLPAFSSDSSKVYAYFSGEDSIREINVSNGSLLRRVNLPNAFGAVTRIATAPDGNKLAAATSAGKVVVIDLTSNNFFIRQAPHNSIASLAFTADSSHILCGGEYGEYSVGEALSQNSLKVVVEGKAALGFYSKSKNRIVTIYESGAVKQRDPTSLATVSTSYIPADTVPSIFDVSESSLHYATEKESSIDLVNLQTNAVSWSKPIDPAVDLPDRVRVSANAKYIGIITLKATLPQSRYEFEIYNTQTDNRIFSDSSVQSYDFLDVDFSQDETRAALARRLPNGKFAVRIYNTANGSLLSESEPFDNHIMVTLPESNQYAIAASKREVRKIDIITGETIWSIPFSTFGEIEMVTISPDERLAITKSNASGVTIFDLEKQTEIGSGSTTWYGSNQFSTNSNAHELSFLPNSSKFVDFNGYGLANLWEIRHARPIVAAISLQENIARIAFDQTADTLYQIQNSDDLENWSDLVQIRATPTDITPQDTETTVEGANFYRVWKYE